MKASKEINETTKGKKEKMKKSIFHYALPAFVLSAAALSAVSCADDELLPGGGTDKDAVVSFNVNDVQENALNAAPATRGGTVAPGFITPGIVAADLAGRKLEATNTAGLDVCLIETTVEGVNPVAADARTRADIKKVIDADFFSTGIRGTGPTSIKSSPEWFRTEKTKSTGELYNPVRWAFAQPYARFFAFFPAKANNSKLSVNNMADGDTAPTVDFEVEPNVGDQEDFMTACTGDVHYATQGVHPTTNLDFRHALTAIRFAVGQNLSWDKTIDKVEIKNAVMKSRYKLSDKLNGDGAGWQIKTTDPRGTATLAGLSVSTSKSPNTTIMGVENTGAGHGDGYTFYMIPQMLTGKGVRAYIHCTDGTEIDVELKGEWKAGTTRTYKLSQKNSTWQYHLTHTPTSRPAAYDEDKSQPYLVKSYREYNGEQQAVPWKVIGYDADGDGKFKMEEKPAWLTGLKTESAGSVLDESCEANLAKAEMKNLLKERNDGLKNAAPLGISTPYDLSTHDYKGNVVARSTANCYLISAPGHYRIPLVYGNAITKGDETNTSAYISQAPATFDPYGADMILHHFQDHLGNPITNPWIEKTNNGANAHINGAKIVWADEANLVSLPSGSSAIVRDGSNAFLEFEVKAANITSGNAVVAATKNGTVVWSWHLWFAPQSALNTIEVTNFQNKTYNFTTETVGWKPTTWSGTTYDKPRTVKVRIEQTIANNGTKEYTDVVITQNPGSKREGIITVYQFGRKDAFPGTDTVFPAKNPTDWDGGNNMSIINGIQNPEKFYTDGNSWRDIPPANYTYYNVWSAGNTATGGNDNTVIKTIYDPSPAGFKMPASNAFTGFTTTGQDVNGNSANINADGTADSYANFRSNWGHNFWTNSSKSATIFFPASGARSVSGSLVVGNVGYYWSAVPNNRVLCSTLFFNWRVVVNPVASFNRPYGFAARPVTEE